MEISKIILSNLVNSEKYTRQVIPFIKEEYFEDNNQSKVFKTIFDYFNTYNKVPEQVILILEVEEKNKTAKVEELKELVKELYSIEKIEDEKWLISNTEKFCQERAMYLAIVKAISIYEGTEQNLASYAVPDIIKDALSISFNSQIGVDWFLDAEERFNLYTQKVDKIPFRLNILNEITDGGVLNKTLNLFLGGVHVGKTMTLVNIAVDFLLSGHNVLFFSLEMSELEILKRIDSNLMDISMLDICDKSKEELTSRFKKIANKSNGSLKVIQFPPSSTHVGILNNSINELKIKKSWKPTIIIIDYLGNLVSSRVKYGGSINSHFMLKAVSEELRGLAIEQDVPVFTAHQLTRGGMTNTDPEMTDTAESIGIVQVADLILALTRTDESDSLNEIIVKQLKNRYRNLGFKQRFSLGCDLEKQKFYDIETPYNQSQIVSDALIRLADQEEYSNNDFNFKKGKKKTIDFDFD